MLYHYINKVPKTAADKGAGTVVSYPFGDQSINLVYGTQNVTNVDECRGVSLYFCKLNKNGTPEVLYQYINKVPKTAPDKGAGTVVSYPFGDQSINLVYGTQYTTKVDECRGVSLFFCKINKNGTPEVLYQYINKVPKTAPDKGTGTVVSYPFGEHSINLVYGTENVTNVDECGGVSLYFCKWNKNGTPEVPYHYINKVPSTAADKGARTVVSYLFGDHISTLCMAQRMSPM